MANASIPTVDLSSFFHEEDADLQKKAKERISHACSEYGFFQVVNHGVPFGLMTRALELSKAFFEYPDEWKLRLSSAPGAPHLAGYVRPSPENYARLTEKLFIHPPGSTLNVFPDDFPELRIVVEELFFHLSKAGSLVKRIITECFDHPPKLFNEHNHDPGSDIMVAHRYFPATNTENKIALPEHQDASVLTFVLQDDVGGLEVLKDEVWIPITPKEGSLVVNVGDIIQVLSNKKYKSATHRVVSPQGISRHSYAFFSNVDGDKWVEPLPKFTKEIGEAAKYRGFFYKDYQQLRLRNVTSHSSRPEDYININHYDIPSN